MSISKGDLPTSDDLSVVEEMKGALQNSLVGARVEAYEAVISLFEMMQEQALVAGNSNRGPGSERP